MLCDKCSKQFKDGTVIFNGNGIYCLCDYCYKVISQGHQPLGQIWFYKETDNCINLKSVDKSKEQTNKFPLAMEMFGKKLKDLTLEERKLYHKTYNRLHRRQYYKYKKKGYKPSFCLINFGKRFCELNKDEKKEFLKLQKRISRKNKLEEEK